MIGFSREPLPAPPVPSTARRLPSPRVQYVISVPRIRCQRIETWTRHVRPKVRSNSSAASPVTTPNHGVVRPHEVTISSTAIEFASATVLRTERGREGPVEVGWKTRRV